MTSVRSAPDAEGARPNGSHGRYADDDVARLVIMRRLTLDGVAPANAARAALEADADELAEHRGADAVDAAREAAEAEAEDDAAEEEPAEPAGRGGGRPFLRAVPGGDARGGGGPRPLGVREAR